MKEIERRRVTLSEATQRHHNYYMRLKMEGKLTGGQFADGGLYNQAVWAERAGLARPIYDLDNWVTYYMKDGRYKEKDPEATEYALRFLPQHLLESGKTVDEIEKGLRDQGFPAEVLNLFLIEQGVIQYKDLGTT